MLYFAYGSNLHPTRLRARIGSADVEGVGFLRERRLVFHKRSTIDGSGKGDAAKAGPGDRVHGALFRLSSEQWSELGRIEGAGVGYELLRVVVETNTGEVSASAFEAQPDFVDPTLVPFDWYRALVIEGASFHRFPEEYIAALEAVETTTDPDRARAAASWALLEEMSSSQKRVRWHVENRNA